ncbi:cytochrome P450 [Rhizopogon vinicolor AM-OR11-026]|uniref:Cytochrome P450 n=1 Tax=Rhizopogon vinicolor AM-OR11-026 TaxID=1314800 RepID=A0A1B7N3X9_9AGAM|nr:cytochrome P450 [Rhizopogon vinicolor AM-OR11-026]
MFTVPKLLICFTVVSLLQRRLRGGLPLPPGPKGLPILGNALEVNVSAPWLSYIDWAKKYGDLMYSTILGHEFIIINSEEVAHALLEQRSGVYADKPFVSIMKLYGMDFNTGSLPYGDQWRQHRKMLHTELKKEASREYQPMQLQKVREFLQNLIGSPTQLALHTRMLSAATVMAVAYGYDVTSVEDRFVTKVEHFLELFLQGVTLGRAALLEAMPFLQYIPSWFPGGTYIRLARDCRSVAREVLDDPVLYVKEEMAGGTTRQSLVKELLGKYTDKDDMGTSEYEETVKGVAATTGSVIQVFFLAMVLHPEVQIKAQEELDKVVGDGRLPDFNDREKLPYIEALYLETRRWRPTVPIPAHPRITTTSDVYNGYYIPKGVIVLTNIWAMSHNETRFPDPTSFKPERHLSPTGELLEGTAPHTFGFGLRQCPGKHLADQSVWIAIVSVLATLRIGKGKDSTGCEINVKPDFTSGLEIRPKPFACSIEPRSANAERLIRASNKRE